MKSRGNLEAEMKERIEFSFMDFILRSQDCNMFIPLPLCPITTNFPNLNPRFVSSLPSIFTPDHQSNKEKKLMLFLLKKEKNIDQECKVVIDQELLTLSDQSGRTEGQCCIFLDLIKFWNIGDMSSF